MMTHLDSFSASLVPFYSHEDSLDYSLPSSHPTTIMPSHHYPVSPPLSSGHYSPYLDNTLYTRAPRMRNVPLPPCPDDYYHPEPSPPRRTSRGVMTPPLSPPHIHPVLSAASTVVRYDFSCNPQTIRMSSSSSLYPSFPSHDHVSSPSASVLYVCCEVTGHTITVYTRNGAVTCLDLMEQLHSFFEGEIGRKEWRGVRSARRSAMKEAYERRTGFAYSASARMKRVDYLLGQTTFKRIVPQHGDSTWLLQTC